MSKRHVNVQRARWERGATGVLAVLRGGPGDACEDPDAGRCFQVGHVEASD